MRIECVVLMMVFAITSLIIGLVYVSYMYMKDTNEAEQQIKTAEYRAEIAERAVVGGRDSYMMKEKLIKSKQRVKDFAEVFTPMHIVKDMCDLIPDEVWNNIESTFLEPACGNGNFLAEIFARKLANCKNERDGLKALASIVGIDIQADNCEESRKRLMHQFCEAFPDANEATILIAAGILQNNIICGDSLQIQKKWTEERKNENRHKV